jgi:hypothetical protein
MQEEILERVARAICKACDENPDSTGDCRGNEYRWHDYTSIAMSAIAAAQGSINLPRNDDLRIELSRLNTLLSDIELDDQGYREALEALVMANDRIESLKNSQQR